VYLAVQQAHSVARLQPDVKCGLARWSMLDRWHSTVRSAHLRTTHSSPG